MNKLKVAETYYNKTRRDVNLHRNVYKIFSSNASRSRETGAIYRGVGFHA